LENREFIKGSGMKMYGKDNLMDNPLNNPLDECNHKCDSKEKDSKIRDKRNYNATCQEFRWDGNGKGSTVKETLSARVRVSVWG